MLNLLLAESHHESPYSRRGSAHSKDPQHPNPAARSPQPAANELLVKVESISLNPIDPLYVAHPLAARDKPLEVTLPAM